MSFKALPVKIQHSKTLQGGTMYSLPAPFPGQMLSIHLKYWEYFYKAFFKKTVRLLRTLS